MDDTSTKSLGSLLGIEVYAKLPANPLELPYTYCKVIITGALFTSSIIEFPREYWDNQAELDKLFNHTIGIGITIALTEKLIIKDEI